MDINGEQFYSSNIEDRLNAFDDRLHVTELINKELGSRLIESDRRNQELEIRLTETEMRNKELELKLKNTLITTDSKFQEVYARLEFSEAELKQTKEKLKDTEGELMHTKVERGYGTRSDKTVSGFKDEISKFTNGTNIIDRKVKYDAGEPETKIMDSKKGWIICINIFCVFHFHYYTSVTEMYSVLRASVC